MCSTSEDISCLDSSIPASPSAPSYLDLDKQELQTVVRSDITSCQSSINNAINVQSGIRNVNETVMDPMDSCFFQATNVTATTNMIQSPVLPVGQAADIMNTSLSVTSTIVTSTSSSLINTCSSLNTVPSITNPSLSSSSSSSVVPIVTGVTSSLASPLVTSPPFHSSSKRPRLKGHDINIGDLEQYHHKKIMRDKDTYCWVCHKEKITISCNSCVRSFHNKCLNNSLYTGQQDIHNSDYDLNNSSSSITNTSLTTGANDNRVWICFECSAITKAEDSRTRSEALKNLPPDEFSKLLTFALQTIKQTADITFHQPVSDTLFPEYKETIIHPMDFNTIEKNILSNQYGCTEALIADVKWILHNCYIFNNHNHPLTKNAQYFFKVAKNEMAEIEVCANCIKNYYTSNEKWFTNPCQRPHLLVWARLKGHPFWPAKAVRRDKEKNEIDCRFFGGHERAWVPAESCYQLSEFYSWSKPKGQKNKFDAAMIELEGHISKIKQMFPNEFKYAPPKTLINPKKLFITSSNDEIESDNEEETKVVNVKTESINDNNNNKEESMDIDKVNNQHKTKLDNKKSTQNSSNVDDKNRLVDTTFSYEDDDDDDEDKLVVNLFDDNTPVTNQKNRNHNKLDNSSTRHSTLSSTSSNKVNLNSENKKQVVDVKKKNVPKLTFTPSPKKPKIKFGKGSSTSSANKTLSNTSTAATGVNSNNAKSTKNTQKSILSANNNNNSDSKININNKLNKDDLKSKQDELEQLRKQLEYERNLHIEEKNELKHKSSLVLLEMRNTLKQDLDNKIKELEDKHLKEIDSIKRKQWCASCLKESIYFCCWNTSYCSYNCQSKHWPKHMPECQQQQHNQQKANLPKTQSHMTNPAN